MLDVGRQRPGHSRRGTRAHFRRVLYRHAPGGNVKGTGIGLSVVLEFVNVHRGKIEIVEGEWPGAHFRIRMPLRAAHCRRAADPARSQGDSTLMRRDPALKSLAWRLALAAGGLHGRCRARRPQRRHAVPDRAQQPKLQAAQLARHARPAATAAAGRAGRAGGGPRLRARMAYEQARRGRPNCAMRLALAAPRPPGARSGAGAAVLRELLAAPETLLPLERASRSSSCSAWTPNCA